MLKSYYITQHTHNSMVYCLNTVIFVTVQRRTLHLMQIMAFTGHVILCSDLMRNSFVALWLNGYEYYDFKIF